MVTYEIQSASVILGQFQGLCVTDALNALASEAGYVSHTDYCDAAGVSEYDWTTDPARFRRGDVSLLVTEVAS